MKKVLFAIFTALVSLLLFPSCNMQDAIIQASVTRDNAACPMDMGNGMTLTGVEYTGTYVTYMIMCDADKYALSQENVTPEMKQRLISTLQTQANLDKNAKKFLDAVRKNRVGIIYHYYVPGSGSPMDVVIESKEL